MVISAFHDGEVYEFAGVEVSGEKLRGLADRTIAKATNPGRVEEVAGTDTSQWTRVNEYRHLGGIHRGGRIGIRTIVA
jgi:hypothetical protein